MFSVVLKKKIEFPNYSQFQTRLDYFEKRPLNSFVNNARVEFSEAGFFFKEKYDQTICFYCGGGFEDCQKGDEPWEERAKWIQDVLL